MRYINTFKIKNQGLNVSRGFTLVETVMVIAISVLILGSFVASISLFYRSNTYALEQAFAVNSARKGIENMMKDIRKVSYSDEGSYPVISMTTSSFSFYSNVDTDAYIEKVRYFIDGTDLKKGVVNSSGTPLSYNDANEIISVISDNVRNNTQSVALFSYYNASGTPVTNTASTTDIIFVTADIVVNVNPLDIVNDFRLRSSATMRNIREAI
ncbi:MAG TPA: type II secretion system protein [Candidatus Kaiserbacteria bacterium]|nr:type II secretion system protein [Candidatus Kaiserbacteria bacterium]